jgi:pyridoxine 5-phosphate synthase
VSVTRLSVNLNKFALLRNSRDTNYPDVGRMAVRAIRVGVDGITVHPRPDQRHIRYSDVSVLRDLTREHGAEFNIEGNPIPEFLARVLEVRPDQCTLVPDAADQLTSDHGWNLSESGTALVPIVRQLQEAGIRVSLFMDPDPAGMELVTSVGADRIELYTESYARAFGAGKEDAVWSRFDAAACLARELGVGVNAGHDLNLRNLGRFLEIPSIREVSIGHAIVVESFDFGFEETLRRYLAIVRRHPGTSR